MAVQRQDTTNVVADLIKVYTSAAESAAEATQRSYDAQLPMRERIASRRQAHEMQELADQALRMVNELTTQATV